MNKHEVARKVKAKVVEQFRAEWQVKVGSKQVRMEDAVGALAKAYGKSPWTIRAYLADSGLTRGRKRRKLGRPKGSVNRVVKSANGRRRRGTLNRLLSVQGRINDLETQLAVLAREKKVLLGSAAVQALLRTLGR